MKSKASISGHPIHPILIGFPIAFFTGTFVFDVLFLVCGRQRFMHTACMLNYAGIVSALAAAVPGFIDYLFIVPPESSAKKRASWHMVLNISVTALFIVCVILRRQSDTSPLIWTGLELLALVLLSMAGWMGGTLVYRNQIGVDMRYAGAGTWKEARLEDRKGLIKVAEMEELEQDQMKLLHWGAKRIVLCRTEKGYQAFDDHCTHKGGSLAGGTLICGTVQCPWHGSQFDVHTGTVKAGPAKKAISTYKIQEEKDGIYIHL